jgi:hypothetical protein
MMTRKDYVAVADILAGYSQAMIDNFWWEDLVNDFSLLFEKDNPNFNRKKFLEACGDFE